MKPHHDFTAERALARHAGLVAQREAQNVDPASGLTRLTERLAADLPELLGALGGETMPEVKALEPRQGVMRELLSRNGGLCSHGLLALTNGGPNLLVSLDAAGALQLVDMAFGGEGKIPDPVPEKLPLSAQLVAARIEAELAALVARIAELGSDGSGAPFAPLRRDTDIAVLRPFAAEADLWQASCEIAYPDCKPWTLRLTIAAEHAPLLCGSDDPQQPRPARETKTDGSAPEGRMFGDIPLTLRATLVDMRIPLARIATLKPGDILPVSVARQVPLSIGDATVAHGTVGEVDDRVALQIINAFSSQDTRS